MLDCGSMWDRFLCCHLGRTVCCIDLNFSFKFYCAVDIEISTTDKTSEKVHGREMNHWMTKLIHMWMLLATSIWGYLSFSNSHSWDNLHLSDIHFYSVILRQHRKQLIPPHARLYFKNLKTASCLIYIFTLKVMCAFKYI